MCVLNATNSYAPTSYHKRIGIRRTNDGIARGVVESHGTRVPENIKNYGMLNFQTILTR